MALRLERPGKTHAYILKADRESEAPTVFALRALTWEETEEVKELNPMTDEQAAKLALIGATARAEGRELNPEEVLRTHAVMREVPGYMKRLGRRAAAALRYGLVEIKGLQDLQGKPCEMSPRDFARQASLEIVLELGAEIDRVTQLGLDMEKNFDAPPAPGRQETDALSVH